MRAAGIAALSLLVLAAAGPAQEPTKADLLKAIQEQLKSANETAGPSVACVVASRSDLYPKPAGTEQSGKLGTFDRAEFLKANPSLNADRVDSHDLSRLASIPDHGYACGVVVDAAGLILTPYHAVEGATKIYVHLPGRVGSYADIHAADARQDLAVLKLLAPPPGLKAIKFGDVRIADKPNEGTVFPGKLVVLMANPYVTGFEINKPNAALGTLTQVRFRATQTRQTVPPRVYHEFGNFLEHDARLNAAVTGAALLNLDGEMIGLTTTAAAIGVGESAAGFALPMDDHVRRVVDVLRRGEEVEYGFLGIVAAADPNGVRIGEITRMGPAEQAGLRQDDVITRINGARTRTYEELLIQVGTGLAGHKAKIEVLRDGRKDDFEVTLAKYKHDEPFIASVRPEPVMGLRVDYGSILAQKARGPRTQPIVVPPGVSVREVVANTPAAAAFKKLGDRPNDWLVTHVGGKRVSTPDEFYKLARGQKSITLAVIDPTQPSRPEREVTIPVKYAICNETFEGWDHARVCARVAELGYTGLELAPFTLAPRITDVTPARRSELRKQAEVAGVRLIGLHWLLAKTEGFHLTSPDAAVRRRTGEYLAELSHAAAEMGGDILVLGSPLQRNVPDGVTPAQGEEYALDTLRHCLPALERDRVYLCLEPLTPAETNFMNTAAEGVALARKLAHPFVRLHLDVKAMSAERAPTPDVIRANREYMHHFHANDPNRRGPGFGNTDFKPIFKALKDVNYTGWVSVEVFDYSPDPDTIARESIRYMRQCEA